MSGALPKMDAAALAALREQAAKIYGAMDPELLRQQTLRMINAMHPDALREQTKTIVGSNYVKMTESRRVARLADFLHRQILHYDEDVAHYFQKHSHWILAIAGTMVVATVILFVTNWLTRRKGWWEKRKLNNALDDALQEVRELQEKLSDLAREEHNQRVEAAQKAGKQVRIWMDGAFDMMHYGHMNAFRQGAALGTYLIVGVNSDESITVNKGQPVCNDEERLACVQGCKFVDEVVENVPYVMSPEYVKYIIEKFEIDFVVHGDDPCLTPDGKDVYAAAKELGKYRSIPRTEGVSTTDIVGRMLLNTRSHHNNKDSYNSLLLKEKESGAVMSPDKKLGRVRAESLNQQDMLRQVGGVNGSSNYNSGENSDDDDVASVRSIAQSKELLAENALHDALYKRKSNFLTTSHILRLFSAGVLPPKPTDRVIYIAGDWDMFHAGHIKTLEMARALGDYLIVGVHGDSIVNARFGFNLPIMNLQERVLSVLGSKNVDDVLIDAPFEITSDMMSALKIHKVVKSDVDIIELPTPHSSRGDLTHIADNEETGRASVDTNLEDPYFVPRQAGALAEITTPSNFKSLTVLDIVDRIKEQKERFEKKFAKKKAAEDEYYAQRYGKQSSKRAQ